MNKSEPTNDPLLAEQIAYYRAIAPDDLEARLTRLGWHIRVMPTAGPFYWGAGTPAREDDG